MAHFTSAALLWLVGKYCYLFALAVLKNCAFYKSVLNVRLANLKALVTYSNDLVEGNLFVNLSVKLFNLDNVTVLNTVLLSACFDNCVHFFTPAIIYSLATDRRAPFYWRNFKKPTICGLYILSQEVIFVKQ